jgi:hypothetical protein
VTVVASPNVELPSEATAYAQSRSVKLVRVAHDDFDPALLQRLALDHEVPCEDEYKTPYEFCLRFVPEINL